MIKKITFENIHSGSSIGTFAFHVEIDDSPSEEDEINIVIEKMLKFPTAKKRIVLITGNYPTGFDDLMSTFMLTLKDKGFIIQVEVPGNRVLPWYNQANRLTVHIDDCRKWPSFPCDEFVLHATGDEAPPEPQVPELNPNIVLSFDPGRLSTIKVFVFLNKATKNWRIYPEANKVHIQVVYKRRS
jgi:hypothetical protein